MSDKLLDKALRTYLRIPGAWVLVVALKDWLADHGFDMYDVREEERE